jgi:undecaprenyl pyrophosphate synthase
MKKGKRENSETKKIVKKIVISASEAIADDKMKSKKVTVSVVVDIANRLNSARTDVDGGVLAVNRVSYCIVLYCIVLYSIAIN